MTEDFVSFRIGNKVEAERHGWISMAEARKMYKTDTDFIEALMGITTFTHESYEEARKNKETWTTFEKKLASTSTLIYCKDIFLKYVEHILKKFIDNGYQRVEFRSLLVKLKDYDKDGNFIGKMPDSAFAHFFDEAAKKIEQEHPYFSVGFIFCIRKSLTEEKIM